MMTKGLDFRRKMVKTNLFYVGVTFGKQYKSIYVFGFKYDTSESTKPDFRSLCLLVKKNFFKKGNIVLLATINHFLKMS